MSENRESFLARLRPVLSPSDVRRVELAYTLAKYHHRSQTRKEADDAGNPIRYFEHVRHVALILIDDARVMDADMICASLLHDSIEDTELSAEHIEQYFGNDVARMVICLSKLPKEGYVDRLIAYPDWRVIMIKLCDRLHNMRSIASCDVSFQKKQVMETRAHFPALFHAGFTIAPPHHARSLELLHTEIARLCQHLCAAW